MGELVQFPVEVADVNTLTREGAEHEQLEIGLHRAAVAEEDGRVRAWHAEPEHLVLLLVGRFADIP